MAEFIAHPEQQQQAAMEFNETRSGLAADLGEASVNAVLEDRHYLTREEMEDRRRELQAESAADLSTIDSALHGLYGSNFATPRDDSLIGRSRW